MDSQRGEATTALLDLYAVMSDQTRAFEGKVTDALEIAATHLGVDNAHLTRIAPEVDYWEAIASTDDETGEFPPGLVLDLQTTYCRRVLAEQDSIALHDAPTQGWSDDPAFETHDLHCYHGTPVYVDGDVFGTVCFVSKTPRESSFSESETLFAELVARLIEHELSVERYEAETRRRANSVTVLSRVLRHNLRNEMTILRGKIGELAADGVEGTETATTVGEIYETIDEIISLSDKARKLETIISTQFDTNPVALDPVLDRVVTDVTLDEPDATIDVDGAKNAVVEARESLELAIRELVENAVKHGGDPPAVRVEVTERDGFVTVSVSDDGPGLPAQERAVLSEGVETPLVHGSGLGLWMVYWIVSNHDGEIDAVVSDAGTTITVTIPQAERTRGAPDQDAVRELERGLDRFEAVFQESFDAMVLVNDDRRIVDANEQASELLGVETADLLGRQFESFAADPADFQGRWAELQATGTDEGEFRLRRDDGEERTVEYSASADVVPGQHLLIGRDVTERKRRERALAETTQQLEGLLRTTEAAAFIKDEDGRYQLMNEKCRELLGIDQDVDVTGMTDEDIFSEDVVARIRRADRRVLETGESVEIEEKIPVDGEERTFLTLKSPLRTDDGEITGLCAISTDITARKRRERQFDVIFNQTFQFTGLLEPDGTVVEINDTALAFAGVDRDVIIGLKLWELPPFQHGDAPDRVKAACERARDGEFVRSEIDVEGAAETVPIDFSLKPVFDDDGSVELLIAEGRDISELKETERELTESTQRLEAIVAASPDPILAIDDEGTIELWNEAAEDVLGYQAEDVLGEPLTEIGLHSDSQRADVADRFQRALAGETFRDLRVTRRRGDGTQLTLSISTAPIRGPDDEVEGLMAVMKPLDDDSAGSGSG